jgi:hypothetical protein
VTTRKDMLRDLAEHNRSNPQTTTPAFSPEVLQVYEQNRKDVEAGILPRYIGGQADNQSQKIE